MSSDCFVATIDLTLAAKLQSDLADQGFCFTKPAYTLFSAQKEGISCTLYQSGKLTVQGKKKEEFILYYLEPEILKTAGYGYETALTDRSAHIGVDEAGKGDFFGPLCIAAVYADEAQIDELIKMGIRDSKRLSDPVSLKLAKQIASLCIHDVIRLFPKKYNELYGKFGNLNTLLAWGHATAIDNTVQKSGCKTVLIDQFGHESLVLRALKDRSIHLTQRHRGEEDVVVAAASILARAAFLNGLSELSSSCGTLLPKGAGTPVKQALAQLRYSKTPEELALLAKLHFKTYTD